MSKSVPDALVEQTMRLVKNIPEAHANATPTLGVVEEVLGEAPKSAGTFAPMVWRNSEREEIKQRVASFKAHQRKMQREREDYCAQTLGKARDLLMSTKVR
jgi:hypothetical protein